MSIISRVKWIWREKNEKSQLKTIIVDKLLKKIVIERCEWVEDLRRQYSTFTSLLDMVIEGSKTKCEWMADVFECIEKETM